MKRKEFLSNVCKAGICSCAAISFLSGTELFAKSEDEAKKALEGNLVFTQRRFAKLLELLNAEVDAETKEKIIQNLGHECAKESKDFYMPHKDNPEGFLSEMKKYSAEKTIYDEKNNVIKIFGKPREKCGCSLVDHSITPKEFCNCSRGWFEETFSSITGKPCKVTIDESILWGGKQCNFTVKIGV